MSQLMESVKVVCSLIGDCKEKLRTYLGNGRRFAGKKEMKVNVRPDQLMGDLEAIRHLFEQRPYSDSCWGYLVNISNPIGQRTWQGQDGDFEEIVHNFTSGFPVPSSRLGLVYLDNSCKSSPCAYADAVCEYLGDGISGILLLSQQDDLFEMPFVQQYRGTYEYKDSRRDIKARARFFFSKMPKELLEAGLPVIFDESGVFEEFSPASEHVHSEQLSFSRLGDAIDGFHVFFHNSENCWFSKTYSSRVFPIVRISDREIAGKISERVRQKRIDWLSLSTSSYMSEVARNHFQMEDELYRLMDFRSIVHGMHQALPNCFGDRTSNAFAFGNRLSEDELPESRLSYPVAVHKEDIPEYELNMLEIERVLNIFNLCLQAILEDENHVLQAERYRKGELGEVFKDACDKSGVVHQVAALDAGVPIEDILA